MRENFSLGYKLTGAVDTSEAVEIYTVSSGELHITRVTVYFPTGSEGYLRVNVRRGIKNIYPTNGYLSGDNTTFVFENEEVFSSGERIVIYYSNTDTTNTHDAYFLFEGYIER